MGWNFTPVTFTFENVAARFGAGNGSRLGGGYEYGSGHLSFRFCSMLEVRNSAVPNPAFDTGTDRGDYRKSLNLSGELGATDILS